MRDTVYFKLPKKFYLHSNTTDKTKNKTKMMKDNRCFFGNSWPINV